MLLRFLRNPFVLLIALLHAYIGARLLPALSPWLAAVGACMLLGSLFSVPKGWHVPEGPKPWSVWIPWGMLGFFSWLLLLTLPRDVALVSASFFLEPAAQAAWTGRSADAVLALAPVITAIGVLMA